MYFRTTKILAILLSDKLLALLVQKVPHTTLYSRIFFPNWGFVETANRNL